MKGRRWCGCGCTPNHYFAAQRRVRGEGEKGRISEGSETITVDYRRWRQYQELVDCPNSCQRCTKIDLYTHLREIVSMDL
jgi:hypothetical protein